MKEKPDRALYVGPSHAAGGIPVVVDSVRPVEVEGQEYKICGEAYRSDEVLSYTQKTNIEILDDIHKNFSCKFEQNVASGNDFIVCKLVVRDLAKRNRKGTVKQILDEMQGEKGCKLSDGSLPEPKMEDGGALQTEPLYVGPIIPDAQTVYSSQDIVLGKTIVLDIAPQAINADTYQISNVAQNVEAIKKICQLAITLPGVTTEEIADLSTSAAAGKLYLDQCNETVIQAGKMKGYSGVAVHIDEDFPTAIVVWNFSRFFPVLIFNKHNLSFFQKQNSLDPRKFADGGELKGYVAQVADNLASMNTEKEEWTAVPVTGTAMVEAKGKEKLMPVFSFPTGYKNAPTKYPSSGDPMNCELCGKMPISTMYWIKNDTKQWIMGVGSECIRHFQVDSGADMLRAAKVAEAHLFLRALKKICIYLQPSRITAFETEPKLLTLKAAKYHNYWMSFYSSDRKSISAYTYFKDLYPFDYEKELAYCLRFPLTSPDVQASDAAQACRQYVEKNMLAWYTRNKKKKIALIEVLCDQLLNHKENLVAYYNDPSLRNVTSDNLKMYEQITAELRTIKEEHE